MRLSRIVRAFLDCDWSHPKCLVAADQYFLQCAMVGSRFGIGGSASASYPRRILPSASQTKSWNCPANGPVALLRNQTDENPSLNFVVPSLKKCQPITIRKTTIAIMNSFAEERILALFLLEVLSCLLLVNRHLRFCTHRIYSFPPFREAVAYSNQHYPLISISCQPYSSHDIADFWGLRLLVNMDCHSHHERH